MILSICIPTYNRGHLAYNRVMELLPYCEKMKGEVELIVSDNGSEKNREEYTKIANLQSEYLQYHRFEENQMFYGNLRQVIKMAKGEFCLIVSDEDTVITNSLDKYLAILRKYKNRLSLMKAHVVGFYEYSEDSVMQAGMEATKEFFLTGNYISGIFYNRSFLSDRVLDFFWNRYRDFSAYQYYPHLMYDAYMLQMGLTITCALPLVKMGTPDELQLTEEEKIVASKTGNPYNFVEARVEQMIGYFLLIADLPVTDIKLKLEMCSRILNKTWALIDLMKDDYMQIGNDWLQILNDTQNMIQAVLEEMDYPHIFHEKDTYILDTIKGFLFDVNIELKKMAIQKMDET